MRVQKVTPSLQASGANTLDLLSARSTSRSSALRRPGRADNEVFTSPTPTGYKSLPGQAEDGAMIEFTLGIAAAIFVHRWVRSAGAALGIPAVTVTALAVLL